MVFGVLAMVVGWSIRPLAIRLDVAEPVISAWTSWWCSCSRAGVGFVALRTWRALQRRTGAVGRMEPYQAVNRLVLGKARRWPARSCSAGTPGSRSPTWGSRSPSCRTSAWSGRPSRAVGGLLLLAAGLVLERACRVRGDDDSIRTLTGMDRHPVSRRRQRSLRITVAVGLLAVATLVVAAAVWTRDARLEAGAAGLGVLAGWAALRLAWNTVLQSRYEHAVDRTEAARTYRQLFADRSVEHREFVRTLDHRLTERERLVEELGNALVDTQTRAAVAETAVKRSQRRLADAEGRIVTLEDYLARSQAETRAVRTELTEVRARLATPMVETRPQSRVRSTVVPEWAHLETDPTAALMAWEEHAQHQARREAEQAADERISKQA